MNLIHPTGFDFFCPRKVYGSFSIIMTFPRIGFTDHCLTLNRQPLLTSVADSVSLLADPRGVGAFLAFTAETPAAWRAFSLGNVENLQRWSACYRHEPYFMDPAAGRCAGKVPVDTQFLMMELDDGNCVLFAPLIDDRFRASLQGAGEDGLELVAESGDPEVVTSSMVGLFISAGTNPYRLAEQSAPSVSAWMKTCRLRYEKQLPAFVDQFGWCTWDAFYRDVSQEGVRQGLENFAAGGVSPRLLILDDGWHTIRRTPSDFVGGMPFWEDRLASFAAAETKFPGGLAPTVQMAKGEFGVETFLVWHAINGYWGGVDEEALPGYGVRSEARQYSPGMLTYLPQDFEYWKVMTGVIPPEHIYRFYQDFHRTLRLQDVDGVKVDNQSSLEYLGKNLGGRVALMRSFHEALEGSVQVHFRGNLINCMSCSNEMIYSTLNSTLMRASTDFWPTKPETHGLHLYTNALVGQWFGEFIHPDWDMFQSAHPMGAFHAVGRAVSGSPVYVSDKPDEHNFDLLRKLVLPDGSILRASGVGRMTRDCLFHDPTREDVLLKVFNFNLDSGVIGVFNARAGETAATLNGTVRPSDVDGLAGEQFAVYAHSFQELRLLGRDEPWQITLAPLNFEIFTIVPLAGGVAPIGLMDMFNSAGAVLAKGWDPFGGYTISLRGGGRFLAWCERKPVAVETDGASVPFAYDPVRHGLEVVLPPEKSATRLKISVLPAADIVRDTIGS
jgi:raffinose synthase